MVLTKFCIYCHFQADYEHFHMEEKWFSEVRDFWDLDDSLQREKFWYPEDVRISDGIFADVNQICLPCQAMRKFNV